MYNTFTGKRITIAHCLLALALCLPALLLAQPGPKLVSIEFAAQDLDRALQHLQEQVNIRIAYDAASVRAREYQVQPARFTAAPLENILHKLLQHAPLSYHITDNTVVILPQERTGRITGRVVDVENGNPLPGATVRIEGTSLAAVTNEKGMFAIERVPPGRYNILFSYVGYRAGALNGIAIEAGKSANASYRMQAGGSLKGITVKGVPRKQVVNTTDEQLIHELYTARTVVSGISNEQIARSMDRDAAEVVKRVPGVNVTDDRFIVIRGLNKRYNVTFLNDNITPATEPDSKAFSFDQVPSNAIDRILIYKSPSPDLPGEFAGGVVKVYTKKSMLSKQLDIQLSAQYRSGTTGKDILSYPGGKYDFLGFDDGTRSLPAGMPNSLLYNYLGTEDKARLSSQFKNNYVPVKYKASPDLRGLLNYYDSWRIGSRRLNNLTSVSYTHTYNNNFIRQQRGPSYSPYSKGFVEQGLTAARLGLIQTNNMNIGGGSLELKHFINQQADKVLVQDASWKDGVAGYFRNMQMVFQSKFLYSGQLSGHFNLGGKHNTTLFANAGYSTSHRSDPDFREIAFHKDAYKVNLQDDNAFIQDAYHRAEWRVGNTVSANAYLRRLFTNIRERSWQANADVEHGFKPWFRAKAGAYWENRYREVTLRSFELAQGPGFYDNNIGFGGYTDPRHENDQPGGNLLNRILHPAVFRADGTGYLYREKSSPNDNYLAENNNLSGYLSLDLFTKNRQLEVFGGLRVENNRLRMLGARQAGMALYPLVVNQPITSVLPSVNIAWRPDSAWIIRAGYGRTVNRPEFREIAPFEYKDFLNLFNYKGNPDLTTVNISNADLRLEWYPKSMLRNELFSIGVFYKQLDRPIEQVLDREIFYEGLYWDIQFRNTGRTNVYGAEAEVRKSLSFLGGNLFRNLSLVFNSAWIYSRVQVPAGYEAGNTSARNRPLQGQTPYIVNAGLNYENPATGTKAAAIFNTSGDMIAIAGSNNYDTDNQIGGFPDIMQKGRHLLDVSFTQRINKFLQVKAGAQNLLNQPIVLFEDRQRNYRYDKEVTEPGKPGTGDNYFRSYKPGVYYSLGMNFIF